MIGDLKAQSRGSRRLQILNGGIRKLLHLPAIHTHDVIVVLTTIQLKDRCTPLKMVARHKPGGLELRKHSIHRRKTHILARVKQHPVNIVST
jgi:hypothetical protein